MYTALLKEFIEFVPVCTTTASLAAVIDMFKQSSSEQVVVVDDQQLPVGVVNLRGLLPYFLVDPSPAVSLEASLLKSNLQQSIQQLSVKVSQPLIEPLISLPADWSLIQLQPYFQSAEQRQWALVDSSDRFVGLLDRLRLWQFLAKNPAPAGEPTVKQPEVQREAFVLLEAIAQEKYYAGKSAGTAGELLSEDTTRASQTEIPAFGISEGMSSSLTSAEDLRLVMAQNTTEQQVTKELAAKNADLMQLNQLKDELLACISHELKTPLTAILGLSNLLKAQLLGNLNERQVRYAQLIYQGSRRLMLIVNDILDLTRVETGQLDLMLEPISIKTVCDRAYEQARQLQLLEAASEEVKTGEPETETRFTLDIQPGLEGIVADELRLRQMLANLLSNALNFTEAGGEIGLKVDSWEGWIAFTVWDTGIGIPATQQPLIFQKFQQLENPLTRRFEGTGLGLVLTQRLARLHRGDITFTSVEGKGSQFTLLLPPSLPLRGPGAGSDLPRVARSITSTAGNRLVLIVESAPQPLENLMNQLTGLGYRVAIARSGTEALEKIRHLQPIAVLLTPLLPLLSGWDVLTLLKADEETRHIPIIVTATRVEKNQAHRNGADGFISLPIQLEALKKSLERSVNSVQADQSRVPQLSLTVLHLNVGEQLSAIDEQPSASNSQRQLTTMDLNTLLHPYHCRVLEVDDLDQADLLARVWQPDVFLLNGFMPELLTYLKQLSRYPFLAALPLVTLTLEITQAANQVSGLSVFPCLAPLIPPSKLDGQSKTSALLQVMQVAVGMN